MHKVNDPSEARHLLVRERNSVRTRLAEWFNQCKRVLPWRANPSVYKIVVSEFMLQQTRVTTVLPYFSRWLDRFPGFAELAAASESEVLHLWEGLGYYARARNLHRLAKSLQGLREPPMSAEDWMRLPGVGPYTAAAIASIGCGQNAAVVDGNVIRILARLTADNQVFRDSGAAFRKFQPLANELIDPGAPGAHNEAMMELGATVCLQRRPLCAVCPLVSLCKAGRRGDANAYPVFRARKSRNSTLHRLWVEHDRRLLLFRAPKGSRRLPDIYELPAEIGIKADCQNDRVLLKKKRTIGNERIQEIIFGHPTTPHLLQKVAQQPFLHWIAFDRLDQVTLSGPHRRWINEILQARH